MPSVHFFLAFHQTLLYFIQERMFEPVNRLNINCLISRREINCKNLTSISRTARSKKYCPDFDYYLGQMYPVEHEIKDTIKSTTSDSDANRERASHFRLRQTQNAVPE